jgi:hypothetical protein
MVLVSFGKFVVVWLVKNFPAFVEPECSLLYSEVCHYSH